MPNDSPAPKPVAAPADLSSLQPHQEAAPHLEALTAACRDIGRALGVTMLMPPNVAQYRHPALEIAACSGVGVRRVTMAERALHPGSGALLAYRAADHQPVVLLRPQSIDRSQYEPIGYLFYRPFPVDLGVRAVFRFVWRMMHAFVAVILGVGAISGLLGVVLPLFTVAVFDHAIPAGEPAQLLLIVGVLLLSSASLALFGVLRARAALHIQGLFDVFVQSALWNRLLSLPTAFFRSFEAGDLAERAAGIGAVKEILADVVIVMLLTGFFAAFNLLVLLALDVSMALWALGLVVVLLALTVGGSFYQLQFHKLIIQLHGRIAGFVLQLLRATTKLRVAGAEMRAFREWAALYTHQQRARYLMRQGLLVIEVITVVYPVLASMLIFVLAYQRQSLTTGMFLAFNLAFSQLLIASGSFGGALTSALSALPLVERLRPLLDAEPEYDPAKRMLPDALTGAVRLDRVSFRYHPNARRIVDEVSLHIDAGEFVAIVGESGSGKSTLLRLMLGLEVPESGTISYDGQLLNTLHLQALRRRIGVVVQDAQLVGRNIFSVIAGVHNVTYDDAWAAAELADIADDIRRLPMGMDTYIGEDNAAFSGGQKQRLLIARALVAHPRIIMFDEALSSLDEASQQRIMHNLRQLHITRIVVTHRPSTISGADRVLELKDGSIFSH